MLVCLAGACTQPTSTLTPTPTSTGGDGDGDGDASSPVPQRTTMTMLDISEAFQAEVRRVLAFASRPENHYLLHESEFEPGDRPEYVIESGTYRLVYTVTVAAGDRWRHLAVTLGKGRLPPPIVVFTAAHMLGFTGGKPDAQGLVEKPADGWEFKKSLETRTVTIIERI